jgi:predicted phage terminase large subunit-like protein
MDEIIQSEGKSRDGPAESQNWKERCAKSLELFCQHYFPDVFTSEFCEFHRDVFRKIEGYILSGDHGGLKKYMARAAPRGHGKSQIISMGLPLWCACYGYRFNILIVSDTAEQAAQFINDIKGELEENEALIADFGNLVGKKTWKTDKIVTANGVHCCAKGAGQKLRGIKYRNKRPDLVIVDDLENDESVETEGQRKKLFNWFMKALLKCGFTDTIFIYIGTILHYEALLYKVLHGKEFGMWDRKIYKAVYEFSPSPLWDEWEKIIMGAAIIGDEEKRDEIALTAYRFYLDHKAEMLQGVKCLWTEKEDDYYYNLMIEKVMDEESFNSEEQNDPLTEESREIKEAWLEANTYETLPEITEIYGAVDPSLGKTKKSDTSAIVIVGRGVDNFLYVMEGDVCRRKPNAIIDDMTGYVLKHYAIMQANGGFVVEEDVWQEYFSNTIKDKFVERGMYVNWIPVKDQGNKELRIKSLARLIQQGYVKFNKNHTTLWNQLKNWPKGHDDGPDALQMAVSKFGAKAAICFDKMHVGRNREQRLPNVFSMMGRRR